MGFISHSLLSNTIHIKKDDNGHPCCFSIDGFYYRIVSYIWCFNCYFVIYIQALHCSNQMLRSPFLTIIHQSLLLAYILYWKVLNNQWQLYYVKFNSLYFSIRGFFSVILFLEVCLDEDQRTGALLNWIGVQVVTLPFRVCIKICKLSPCYYCTLRWQPKLVTELPLCSRLVMWPREILIICKINSNSQIGRE